MRVNRNNTITDDDNSNKFLSPAELVLHFFIVLCNFLFILVLLT